MKVVGLDISVGSPGFADDERAWSVKVPAKLSGPERLEFLRKTVRMVTTPPPDLVVIESYFLSARSPTAVIPLAEVGGVIRLTLWRAGIPFVDVAPTRLKQFATGKGQAGKGDMILAAFKRGRVEFTDKENDACDAWWLRQMGLHAYGLPGAVPIPQTQSAVLKGMEWPELKGAEVPA